MKFDKVKLNIANLKKTSYGRQVLATLRKRPYCLDKSSKGEIFSTHASGEVVRVRFLNKRQTSVQVSLVLEHLIAVEKAPRHPLTGIFK